MARTVDPVAHAKKRAAILGAAYRCIADHGYPGATTTLICAEAGISSGTFFHYFPTKLSVLLALLDADLDTTVNSVSSDPLDTVRSFLQSNVDEANDPHHSGFVLAVAALVNVEPAVAEALQIGDERSLEILESAIVQGQREKQFDHEADPRAVALRLMVLIDGFHARATVTEFDIVAEGEWLIELALSVIPKP